MSKLKRNDPCHCGSGKKYKKCCMEKDAAAENTLAAQNFLAPLMDMAEDEEIQKKFNEGFLKSLDYDDEYEDIFDNDELDEYSIGDEYPELSEDEIDLVEDWWEKYFKCEDALSVRQHLEDFMNAHPELLIYLDLHMEVLFELGGGYLKLGKIDDHIQLLMRFRKEFPDVYIQSFEFYDSDIIAWLISKNRTAEIPEYLNHFIDSPVESVDKLFDVLHILSAKDLTDELLHLAGKVYETICTSDDVMGGDEILIPLITAKYAAYLKPDFSDEDIAKLVAELADFKAIINPNNLKTSFWKEIFKTIYKPFSKWETPEQLTQENIAKLHYDIRLNYMRFLKEKTGISWIAAHYYALMLSEYLYTWHKEIKNKKNAIWDFSSKTIKLIVSKLTRSFFTNYDATKVASIYNAIYYFSEYLLQCGNIDQSQASAIQQVCIKGFGKAYPNLEKQDVFALAFKNFPEWG